MDDTCFAKHSQNIETIGLTIYEKLKTSVPVSPNMLSQIFEYMSFPPSDVYRNIVKTLENNAKWAQCVDDINVDSDGRSVLAVFAIHDPERLYRLISSNLFLSTTYIDYQISSFKTPFIEYLWTCERRGISYRTVIDSINLIRKESGYRVLNKYITPQHVQTNRSLFSSFLSTLLRKNRTTKLSRRINLL